MLYLITNFFSLSNDIIPKWFAGIGLTHFTSSGSANIPNSSPKVAIWTKSSNTPSELGDATAQELLAFSYLLGYGVERNLSEYKKWMKAAEKNGCIHAQHFSETYDSEDSFLEKSIKQEEREN